MPEHQNEEWKECWRDEYLKWICGFANAQGGRIYIGVNDKGVVTGVADYARLLEDIPNKVQMSLGIMVDVNLLTSNNLYYIEINVAPSSFAVNYKGEYHYRTGSTKQQLKGAALTDFLLKKAGGQMRWDAQPAPHFQIEDLDLESFEIFRTAAGNCGRVGETDLKVSNRELLNRLDLITPEGYLKRAAVLLFCRRPERLISGCYVKIAMFGRGSELRYQEEVRGSLFIIAERLIELVYLKYLKASISYNNKQRMEKYPYPQAALREIFYNALIHCNWSANEPIYVKVTDNSLSVSNVCALPLGWSQETLMNAHKSKPFNPDIANTFFRAGYVEIWGRGFAKVLESCSAAGLAPPAVELLGEDITVTLRRGNSRPVQAAPRPTDHPAPQREFSELESLIVAEIKNNPQTTLTHIAQKAGVSKRSVQTAVNRLAVAGVLCREGTPRRGKWILL